MNVIFGFFFFFGRGVEGGGVAFKESSGCAVSPMSYLNGDDCCGPLLFIILDTIYIFN